MARDTFSITGELREHLARAGVPLPPVEKTITTDEFFALWRSIDDGRADRGLVIGVTLFGRSVSAQAALQAPTLGDALRTIARYKRIVCPEEVLIEVHDGEATLRFDWVLATGEVPPLLVDAVLASTCKLVGRATGGKVAPLRIELSRKRRHAQVLRDHFRCPIVFGAPHDGIVLTARALATPLVTASREAYALLVPGLEARLAATRSLLGDVRIAIARTIAAGARPSIDVIAERLDTSPRTLQRRLGEARTTFQDQLDDVRRVAARRLLAQTELPPIDIAFLLGFAEPNSFARAFRAWERTTPLRWRAARS